MAFADSTSRRVRKPQSHESSSNRRRNGLKALSRGLAAVVLGFVFVTTAMIGAGWALAVTFQARTDAKSAVALAQPFDRRAWIGPLNGGTEAWRTVIAVSPLIDVPQTVEVVEPMPVKVATLSIRAAPATSDAFADPAVTGSIGTAPANTFVLASADSTVTPAQLGDVPPPARLVDVPPSPDEARASPLPRVRPKLASLVPMDGLRMKPDEEVRPPRTAIYDISARTVYLPNGERLEAHSGVGQFMDDPRYSRMKMRGPTPPNTYELKMRETLFHGVAAIRLTPVDDKAMYGRDGILAHSYLLGPAGQSHGCISFKDYPRFLRAFQRGEIERIVVVERLGKPPTFAARSNDRSATN